MSQASELAKMRRKRTVKKNIAKKDLFADCEALIAGDRTDETVKEAKVLLQTLMETTEEVRKLDDMVSDLIADDVEFEANETAAYQFLIAAKRMEGEIKAFMTPLIEPQRIKQETEITPARAVGVKLPKIKIKIFDGDAIHWQAFIEAFHATINVRTDLSDIEKFTYLKGF